MKDESLNALLIDRELEELTPEAIELLETWLAEHPERAAEVSKLRDTLAVARETVRGSPELGGPDLNVITIDRSRAPLIPLALAASLILLLGVSGWFGFVAGQRSTEGRVPESVTDEARPPTGPWAQYALASSPQGELTVVRNDIKN